MLGSVWQYLIPRTVLGWSRTGHDFVPFLGSLKVRIDIDDLVQGRVRMARGVERKIAAKGRFKIESYPGEKPETVIVNLIEECLES